jgi:hypothetical protein
MNEKFKLIFGAIILILMVIGLWTSIIYFMFNTEAVKEHPCEICEKKYNETCTSGKSMVFRNGIPTGIQLDKNLNLSKFS